MDAHDLEARLEAFSNAVEDGPYPRPGPGEWSAGQILAHAATVNRLVALSVASLIGGEPIPYSNRLAASEPLLRGIVTAAAGLGPLRDEVLRTGRVLIELATELGPVATSPIATHIAEGEVVLVDGPVPAMALIASVLGYHLSVHVEQLAALRSREAVPGAGPTAPVAA